MSETEDAARLRTRELRKTYGKEAALVRAVDGVDLEVGGGTRLRARGW